MKKYIVYAIAVFILFGGYFYFSYSPNFYKGEIIGIAGQSNYHRDNCLFVKKADYKSLKFYASLYNTAAAGDRPCKTCNPPDNTKEISAALTNYKAELDALLSEAKKKDEEWNPAPVPEQTPRKIGDFQIPGSGGLIKQIKPDFFNTKEINDYKNKIDQLQAIIDNR